MVVVGDEVRTSRPVTSSARTRPVVGRPPGLLAGLAGFPAPPRLVVVLAVDMPLVTPATVGRLLQSAGGRDGALLVDDDGRRQYLCAVYRTEALRARRAAAGGAARSADAAAGDDLRAGRGPGARPGRPATWTPGRTSATCASGSTAERASERHFGSCCDPADVRSRL